MMGGFKWIDTTVHTCMEQGQSYPNSLLPDTNQVVLKQKCIRDNTDIMEANDLTSLDMTHGSCASPKTSMTYYIRMHSSRLNRLLDPSLD
jgi:hypothetical protein